MKLLTVLVLHILEKVKSNWSRLEGLLGYTNRVAMKKYALNKNTVFSLRKSSKLVLGCEWVNWFDNVHVYVEN